MNKEKPEDKTIEYTQKLVNADSTEEIFRVIGEYKGKNYNINVVAYHLIIQMYIMMTFFRKEMFKSSNKNNAETKNN